jgi:predicted metal-binding membrane protein
MTAVLVALIVLAAGLTLYALVRGIMTMASGRDALENGDGVQGLKSNRMMTMRVIFQAITILLVVILFLATGGSFIR